MTALTWTKTTKHFGHEYVASNGARVYRLSSKAFQTEWGVQLPQWDSGDGGFRSMTEAKAYAERHSEPREVSDDQFLAALGPCGK